MGAVAKGELPSRFPGETLIDRALAVGRDARFERFVLVGSPARLAPYARYSLEAVHDREGIDGPVAGLAALCALERAPFVMVGCDMPALDAAVLDRLRHGCAGALLAPRDANGQRWEPMLSWVHPARARDAVERAVREGARSFQRVFSAMDCVEFVLSIQERACLEDWDTPEDRAR